MNQRPQYWGKCSTFKAIANEWSPLLCKMYSTNLLHQFLLNWHQAEMLHADCLTEPKLSQQFIKMIDWWRNRTAEADASLLQETCIFLLNNFSTFVKKHSTKFWSCSRWGQISEFYIKTTEFLTALWISLPKFAFLNVFFSVKDVASRR